ncbi:MAG: PKD domain-containing protein, partial [Flavobacteriales bacterium]
ILWDKLYEIPSPGYTTTTDIYDAFSAGQQPRINHPEMAINRNTGSGYEFVGYRKNNGSPFELEMVKTDLVGNNYCTSSPLGFNLMTVTWYDQQNTNSITANPVQNLAGNVRNIINSVEAPCYVIQTECDVDPDIKAQISDCVVWFNPIQNGTTPDADLCYSWDFGDGSPIEFGGTVMHVYPMSGTYTACLTMWCCDDPSTAVTFCETITVDCPGDCELPEPGFTWECVNGGLQLTATNFGGPVDPSLYCWEWENGVQNDPNLFIILPDPCPDSWGHCISMWCCDDPSTVQTVCIDFLIDCCDHPCEPLTEEEIDFSWGATTHPSCTDGCAIGFNCPVVDPDKYCVLWDFGDGETFTDVNSCPIHCFQCSGVYDVCLTVYCCEDPSISTTVCHQVEVQCCNLPDVNDFYLGLNQEDCSVDVLIDIPVSDCPDDNICYYVDFGEGPLVHNTPAISYTYLTGGLKTVCLYIYCCGDPFYELEICKDIEVECDPCVLPSSMWFDYTTDEDCKTVFTPVVTSDYEGDLCSEWEINGVIYPQPNFLLDYCHQFTEDGVYTVCYRVYCCEDPTVYLEHCETIEINCCT